MRWRKLGLIYRPAGEYWWAREYATMPTADVVDERTIRIYFASLDEHRFGRIGHVTLDASDPRRVLGETREPVLDLGPRGAFDDSGVNPSCVVRVGDHTFLYYIGWQRCERVPYMLFTGLAMQRADGPFRRYAQVPVLDRTPSEPYSRSAPCVRRDGSLLRAWYWSCERWSSKGDRVHYNNSIRHAESDDGIHWTSTGQVCVAPAGDEYSIGRPWVLCDGDTYKMWYAVRSHHAPTYRIGYAESPDGLAWTRKDAEAGIAPAADGWDAQMICYPCVVDAGGRRYMFYNGNGHGLTGFGCAVLEG